MSMSNTEKRVEHIRRKTRRKFSAEEQIRIVLEGLRGECSIRSGSISPFSPLNIAGILRITPGQEVQVFQGSLPLPGAFLTISSINDGTFLFEMPVMVLSGNFRPLDKLGARRAGQTLGWNFRLRKMSRELFGRYRSNNILFKVEKTQLKFMTFLSYLQHLTRITSRFCYV